MEKNMRIMGLDFGSKTVGVAVCDPLGITAQMVETIFREKESKLRRTLARIEELVREYEIEAIVLGYPKNNKLYVKDIIINNGASFITILLGKILTMPGLPLEPNYEKIDLVNGEIKGLF